MLPVYDHQRMSQTIECQKYFLSERDPTHHYVLERKQSKVCMGFEDILFEYALQTDKFHNDKMLDFIDKYLRNNFAR